MGGLVGAVAIIIVILALSLTISTVDTLVNAISSLVVVDAKSKKYKAGEKLHEFGACNNCHFYGDTFPLQGPQTWAPNLAMSRDRLRSDWIVAWLRNPQEIMPGTKMPAPYLPTSDLLLLSDAEEIWGKSLIKIGGDENLMLEGLRDYMLNIQGKTDISELVKNYFKENGYHFEEEEEDDDDW